MILLLALIGLKFAPLGYAQENSPTFHVEALDPRVNSKSLAKPGIEIHTPSQTRSGEWHAPQTEVRDAAIQSAGLSQEVKAWDPLALDMLYLRASEYKFDRFRSHYSQIEIEKLRLFQNLVLENKKSKN